MSKSESAGRLTRRQILGTAATALAGSQFACTGDPPSTPSAVGGQLTGRDRLKTTLPKPNGLNLVVIVADTWRCDHIGAYGAPKAKTPHLDQLANDGVLFENSYADGLPTIPCRRVWHAGRSLLKEKGGWWRPMDPEDVTLAEILSKAGFGTGLIVDTFHYFKPGMNFHKGFGSFQWIRGQESDAWVTGPMDQFDPASHMPPYHVNDRYIRLMKQYMANTARRESEEDYFCAQSTKAAMSWLEHSTRQKPFFLWIDMFDPHEPWDAPRQFQKMYRDDYGFDRYLFGYGVQNKDIRETDYPIISDLYAAEVTFSDYWIGRLLEKIDQLGMRDDTIVVFMSDHGTHLGELGCVQKTPGLLNSAVAHIPLIVRHPDRKFAGKRVAGFVNAIDYMPTFLDVLGIKEFPGLDGNNFWTMAESETANNYDRTFFGYGGFAGVRDQKWYYFDRFRGNDPGKAPALYDMEADPGQKTNVVEQHPEVAAERRELIAERFDAEMPPPTPS
ncbi:MAG: sulfatase-like hydrolase/transferase [bacterium]|nr:sulfatase-like hydrolase/transferase [bacterium]